MKCMWYCFIRLNDISLTSNVPAAGVTGPTDEENEGKMVKIVDTAFSIKIKINKLIITNYCYIKKEKKKAISGFCLYIQDPISEWPISKH